MKLRKGIFLLLISVIMACKADKPGLISTDPAENQAFEEYLEDYEGSRYKWGYLNTEGKLALENDFDDCRDFESGTAVVNIKGKWGMIDKLGKIVIQPRWRSLSSFREDIAMARSFSGTYYGLSRSDDTLFSIKAEECLPLSGGRARINFKGQWGYIDKDGTVTIPPTYDKTTDFSEGYAAVKNDRGWTIIDGDGNEITNNSYDKVIPPKEEMIRVKENGKWNFINVKTLHNLSSTPFSMAGPFNEGLAVVRDDTGLGLIDKKGLVRYLDCDHLEYGGPDRWLYVDEGQYGFIDHLMTPVIPAQYDMSYTFEEGRAAVALADEWGYIDIEGTLIKEPFSPLVWNFHHGYARVVVSGGISFVDSNFDYIMDRKFYEVRDFNDGLARVQVYK